MRLLLLLPLALAACGDKEPTAVDNDGDGFFAEFDCDDDDPDVNDDAPEVCDGVDNDCDGLVDDRDNSLDPATASPFYADTDGDGYGNTAQVVYGCELPPGAAATGGDCNDSNLEVNPGAPEVCDGRDNDCDGLIDTDDDSLDAAPVWYVDADADGYGDPASEVRACARPSGQHIAQGEDCNDRSNLVHPGAAEVCDTLDNDCDALVDDDDDSLDLTTARSWYPDADSDGYGDEAAPPTRACAAPEGSVLNGEDCDDLDAAWNPAAEDVCDDELDQDCDGEADGGCTTCGDGVLEPGEEGDPPPGPWSRVSLDPQTCRWDFSAVRQLYCSGTCTWGGGSGCDQADADIFCKLKLDDPNATAVSWTDSSAQPEHGFPCAPLGLGSPINVVDRGVTQPVRWQDTSILASHGGGRVILDPVCRH